MFNIVRAHSAWVDKRFESNARRTVCLATLSNFVTIHKKISSRLWDDNSSSLHNSYIRVSAWSFLVIQLYISYIQVPWYGLVGSFWHLLSNGWRRAPPLYLCLTSFARNSITSSSLVHGCAIIVEHYILSAAATIRLLEVDQRDNFPSGDSRKQTRRPG